MPCWWSDHIANYCAEKHLFPSYKKYVSGLGDGGLIDAARIGFGGQENFSHAVRLISVLRHEKYRRIPTEHVERGEVSRSDFEKEFKAGLGGWSKQGFRSKLETEIKKIILREDKYSGEIWDPAREVLKDLLDERDNAGEDLCLVGREEYFNAPDKASPINVFLFGLLQSGIDSTGKQFRNNTISYAWGEFKRGASVSAKKVGKKTKNQPSLEIFQQIDGEKKTIDTIEIPPSGMQMIFLRHGPSDRAFRRFIGTESGQEYAGMEPDRPGHGLNMGPLLRVSEKSQDLLPRLLGLVPERDEAERVKVQYKQDLVSELVDEIFGNFPAVTPCPDANGRVAYFEIALPFTSNLRKYEKLGGFDRQMFGVPVVYRNIETAPIDPETGEPVAFFGSAMPKHAVE